jgi:hypothetical protein
VVDFRSPDVVAPLTDAKGAGQLADEHVAELPSPCDSRMSDSSWCSKQRSYDD